MLHFDRVNPGNSAPPCDLSPLVGSAFLHKGSVLQLFCWCSAVFLILSLLSLHELFPQRQTTIIRLVLLVLEAGTLLDDLCTGCGLVSFGLRGPLQRLKVGHWVPWSGAGVCEAAQVFVLGFEETSPCADSLEGVGREGRGWGKKEFSFLKHTF